MNHIELSINEFNQQMRYNCISESFLMYRLFYCMTAMYTVEDLKTTSDRTRYELFVSITDGFLHKKVIDSIRYSAKTNIALEKMETLNYICENVILLINTYNRSKKKNRIENILIFPECKLKDSLIKMGLLYGDKTVKTEFANYKLKNK